VQKLHNQLDNILKENGYLALSKNYEEQVNKNWSISYDYFSWSTVQPQFDCNPVGLQSVSVNSSKQKVKR